MTLESELLKMSTNCQISPDCFVHRMAALPLISFSAQQALTAYQKTKNFNSLFGATFSVVEHGLTIVAEKAEPVYHRIEKPLVNASKVACVGLDKLEDRVPAIKMTPEEVKEASVQYYNQSYAKKGVDTITATKNYGTEKLEQTKDVARNTALAAVKGTSAMVHVVRHPLLSLNYSLDFCDGLIDRYVAEGEVFELAPDHDYSSVSCFEKVHLMGGKVASGVRIKTNRQLQATKEQINVQVESLQGALELVEYAKSTADWAKKSAATNLEHLRENATVLIRSIDAQAKKHNISPEALLLRWIQKTSSVTAGLTNQLMVVGSAYFPIKAQESLKWMSQYINEINITLAEAQNLGEIKGEFLAETKDKLAIAQQKLIDAIDYVADYPPLTWLKNYIPSHEKSEKAEQSLQNGIQNGTIVESHDE